MKALNVNSKHSIVLIKGIVTASLAIALQGLQVGCPSPTSGTANYRATHPDLKKFREEIDNLRDISIPDEKGRSKLYAAVKNQSLPQVKILLERWDIDKKSGFTHKYPDFINTPDPKSGNTPLMLAVNIQATPIVNYLVNRDDTKVQVTDKAGDTLLNKAIINGQSYAAIKICERARQAETPELLLQQNKKGSTPAHLAIIHKQKSVATEISTHQNWVPRLLLQQDKAGNTPLHLAIIQQQPEIAIKMIGPKEGASEVLLKQNNEGNTPLHEAIKHKQQNIVKTMLEQQGLSKLLLKQNKKKNTPLHAAIKHKQQEIAKAILDQQGPSELLSQQNNEGNTPVHLAIIHNFPALAIQMTNHQDWHKELSIRNKKDKTIIDLAIQHDPDRAILLIKQLPIEALCEKNTKGQTLLHITADQKLFHVFKQVSDQINQLAGPTRLAKELSATTTDGKSVWHYIGSRKQNGIWPGSSSTNTSTKICEYAISLVKDSLTPADRAAITDTINILKNSISAAHADQLLKIVNPPVATTG